MLVDSSLVPIITVGLSGFVACRCASLADIIAQRTYKIRLLHLSGWYCCTCHPHSQEGAAGVMLVSSSGVSTIPAGLQNFVASVPADPSRDYQGRCFAPYTLIAQQVAPADLSSRLHMPIYSTWPGLMS